MYCFCIFAHLLLALSVLRVPAAMIDRRSPYGRFWGSQQEFLEVYVSAHTEVIIMNRSAGAIGSRVRKVAMCAGRYQERRR